LLTYYCWQCYAANDSPRGPCAECGEEIAPPQGTDYVALLLWALDHPLAERQMVAARTLGHRREPRARPPLLRLVTGAGDPYLGAEAVRALVAIDGVEQHRQLLEKLARSGSVVVRRAAADALAAPFRHQRQA